MHYFKFHGAPDEPVDLTGRRPKTFVRTADYLKLEIRQNGVPWQPFPGGDAWSVGSRTATHEEAEA